VLVQIPSSFAHTSNFIDESMHFAVAIQRQANAHINLAYILVPSSIPSFIDLKMHAIAPKICKERGLGQHSNIQKSKPWHWTFEMHWGVLKSHVVYAQIFL